MIDKLRALFPGTVSRYLLYAIAALLALVVTLAWLLRAEIRHTGALKAQRDQLQQSLEDQTETLRQTLAEQKRTENLLAARERERNGARQATAALKRRITQLEGQADEAYQACLDMRIPAAVLNELRAAGAD